MVSCLWTFLNLEHRIGYIYIYICLVYLRYIHFPNRCLLASGIYRNPSSSTSMTKSSYQENVMIHAFYFCISKWLNNRQIHYCDVIMGVMASQITSRTIVYSTVYSGLDQRKHQSSASLAFVRGIHQWPVNSPHKRLVTQKMLPFDHHVKNSTISSMHCSQRLPLLW